MTAPSPPAGPENSTRKIDINPTQVAAASLGAMTAAAVGSQLGIAGTLVGAAAASMTLNVGTALYRASLERSRERIRLLARRAQSIPIGRSQSGEPSPTIDSPLRAAHKPDDRSGDAVSEDVDQEPESASQPRQFAYVRWGAAVVGALAAFVLAMMVITGYEAVRGETLGGHGEGTSLGNVVTPSGPAPAVPDDVMTSTPPDSVTPETTPPETTPPETTLSITPAPEDDPSDEQSSSETGEEPSPTEVETTPRLPPLLPRPGN